MKTQTGLCECGCGSKTTVAKWTKASRGHVKGEHVRFLPGHNHGKGPTPEPFKIDDESGCWIWQRARRKGYGVVGRRAAHRVMYEQVHGPVPEGLQLDHLCRNRACVNPSHLEPVTAAENQRRGANTKLTADQVRAIKRLLGKESQRSIAAAFGVSQGAISRIARAQIWADIV